MPYQCGSAGLKKCTVLFTAHMPLCQTPQKHRKSCVQHMKFKCYHKQIFPDKYRLFYEQCVITALCDNGTNLFSHTLLHISAASSQTYCDRFILLRLWRKVTRWITTQYQLQNSCSVKWDQRMIINYELEGIWKEVVLTYLKTLAHPSP